MHQVNTNNTKHIYSTMHYETKNQKVHRTKELDSHITESGFLLYIDSCFFKIKYYDIELFEKFIWMCIHTVSMHTYINIYWKNKLNGTMKTV